MTRISLFLSLLLLGLPFVEAQERTTYPSTYQPVPVLEAEMPNISVFNAFRINSGDYEFSPTYYKDGIVYVAAQEAKAAKNRKKNTPFFELFYAEIGADGMPRQPSSFSAQVNTRSHEGQASFNGTEDLIYYTGNSEFKNANGQYSMKIYEARKGEKDWEHIVDMPFNSEAYSNQHPAISADGQQLYFASDMPGGYGGTDIYVVEKEGAYWGIPRNLGEQINTPENDAFPFVYKEEYLFFSSKGHGGLGDYDIFAVNIDGGLPGPILHLANPINSPKADIGFILNETGMHGFFSSNRINGSGKDDIYLFEAPLGFLNNLSLTPSKPVAIETTPSASIAESVADKSETAVSSPSIATDSKEATISEPSPITASEERLLAKLAASMESANPKEAAPVKKKSNKKSNRSKKTKATKSAKSSSPVATELASATPKKAVPTNNKVSKQANIAQKTNTPKPPISTSPKVAGIVKEKPALTAKKAVPTKPIVNKKSNASQKKVIPKSPTSAPIVSPTIPAACTQLSGILIKEHNGQIIANATISIRSSCGGMPLELSTNQSGMFEVCLPFQCQYIVAATKAGYETNDLFFTITKEKTLKKSLTLRTSQTAPPAIATAQQGEQLQLGSRLQLQPIYYDLQNGRIRPADAIELDAIAQMMRQYASIAIELVEHTDARGSAHYNQELSQTRARIAKDYLVQQHGLATSRITAIGMGEKQLRNHCSDEATCTDEEHQYNRRTEIKIVKMAERGKIWFGR